MQTLRLTKPHTRNKDVEKLQKMLASLGMYTLKQDDIFGQGCKRAVMAFQHTRGLLVDGIVGPNTWGALERAYLAKLRHGEGDLGPENDVLVPTDVKRIRACSTATWERAVKFAEKASKGVVYGPGRGFFDDTTSTWLFTIWHKPNLKGGWPSTKGALRVPSAHCSGLTNLFLGYMTNANENFTPTGNQALLWDVCLKTSRALHPVKYKGKVVTHYRGYGEYCMRLASDGRSEHPYKKRKAYKDKVLDAQEIWERRTELSAINVIGMAFRKRNKRTGKLRYVFCHTGILLYNRGEDELYYLAADGGKVGRKYTAKKVVFKKLNQQWAASSKTLFQVFRVVPDMSGNFGSDRLEYPIEYEDA